MSIEQASPLVPIKPQVTLQNSAFIKNSHNRSSFCGVVPSPNNGNGTLKTFAVNRKSWSGNGTLPLQQYFGDTSDLTPSTPELATFRTHTGTFPRNRERNNNNSESNSGQNGGILTPNGNSTQTFRGNEVRRAGSVGGRRYAEIGNWNKRSSTFLEPHIQGVGVRGGGDGRDSRSSESDARDDRSTATEDDERALLRRASPRLSARMRKTRRNDNSPPFRSERLDNAPDHLDSPGEAALKPREFFERLQSQAMQERKTPPQPAPRRFRSPRGERQRPPSLGDSLSQSRESLSSDGEGARGDCSSVGSSGSGSEPQPPCDIGLLERLIRSHPVWFLPGIQRAGAFHLLQGKEEGNFVVRQSSQPDTMAISVRLPADKGPYIEHYLIQAGGGRIALETSQNKFDNIPELIAHYSQCCDELPVQLMLPRPLREAKGRHQLNSLALLGQEFWGYPMANPKNNPQNLLSPCQLANEVMPMALTPSDTGSSLSSFNTGVVNNQSFSLESDQNLTSKHSPMESSGSPPNNQLSTFKGRSAPSPPVQKNGSFVRAPRPTPPNTLNLISSTNNRLSPEGECISSITATLHGSFKRQFTEQNVTDPASPQDTNTDSADPANTFKSSSFVQNQVISPNGSNSVTSGIYSPTSQINSPISNETVSSKSGVFSPLSQITNKSEIFSPVSRSSPMSGNNVFSPISSQSFNVGSPLMGKERDKLVSPSTNTASSTPSGRSRRSKHSMRKESRHYQESDILESPGVYCRSSLLDKVSDYEDIWGPETNGNCTTFKPKPDSDNMASKGIMMSKRPDLLPDTLPKLNNAKSTQSILEKENMILMSSSDSLNKKQLIEQDQILKQNFKNSNELIATTNSKGEIIPKRPDQLNLIRSVNKLLNEEIEAANKENDLSMDISKTNENLNGSDKTVTSEKEKAGSPFYADPVDALKEAADLPLVQRRKLLRVGASLAQRYSEPPNNHPYYPLRDMHSIEELSPSSPNTSNSVDNLIALRTSRPKMKPVQPPRINGKPPVGRHDPTWTVDSSWEFINKNEEPACSESGTFPSLAEQESRLSGVDDALQHLTVHHVVAQRFPELRLNGAPVTLAEEVRSPPRASCYDNVLDHRPISEQASDDGTVFSEPWDSTQWDGLLPPTNSLLVNDGEEEREWESPVCGRKPLSAISRAKSFRDRLDPLLAAGRVRALRGCRGSRGAGAALRAYALHLAQDKSTTFAQNVDHFIACTLDSKEICPQVVMRNMRQFMSGMKNYLVKHGEREFEKEVEKERMKLKSTEFLNLDAILETVMHRLVVRPLRARLYTLLANWHASDVRALHSAIEHAAPATPLQMGIKASTNIPSPAVMATISKHFLKMQEADSPLDKLENLLAAISAIFNSIRGERALGADDLLPMLAWVVSRCRLVCAELEAELMAGLLPPALLAGEGGYYLTALFSAVAVLKKLAPDQPQDPATLWRRSSLESSSGGGQACVVRVALPDECRGSIRRVALPCRPGARARDLCRALAHQAAITNPQDYALFALHNGQETMLSENDCPQDVMSEKNEKNCILAYKRIDAKIAWPQQALLSLP